MNSQVNAEKEDVNNPLNQGSNNKIKNIILVNNSLSGRDDPDTLWPGGFFGTKMPNGGASFIAEALQKPGISNLYNFNAGICPEYDIKKDYYKEFWRVYLQNEIILIDMKDYVLDIKNLQDQIKKVEEHHRSLEADKQQSLKEKGLEKKKNRRPASEIQKNHLCPYESCNKFYGSEVSLNLHIKLKHKGGNKTDREKLAISIVKAKMSGEDLPELNLNLPPGFLEVMYQTQIQVDPLLKLEKTENSIKEVSFDSQNLQPPRSRLSLEIDERVKFEYHENDLKQFSKGTQQKLQKTSQNDPINHKLGSEMRIQGGSKKKSL